MKPQTFLALGNHPIQLPYALAKLPVDGPVWLPLNRNYKPLGSPWQGHLWVDYLDFAEQAIEFLSDPRRWKDVWNKKTPTMLWLKNDGTPADVYFARLAKLMDAPWRAPHPESISRGRAGETKKLIKQVGWQAAAEVARELGFRAREKGGADFLALEAISMRLDSELRARLRRLRLKESPAR